MSEKTKNVDTADRSRLHLVGVLTAVAASSACNPAASVDPDESPFLSDAPTEPRYPRPEPAGGEGGEGGGD